MGGPLETLTGFLFGGLRDTPPSTRLLSLRAEELKILRKLELCPKDVRSGSKKFRLWVSFISAISLAYIFGLYYRLIPYDPTTCLLTGATVSSLYIVSWARKAVTDYRSRKLVQHLNKELTSVRTQIQDTMSKVKENLEEVYKIIPMMPDELLSPMLRHYKCDKILQDRTKRHQMMAETDMNRIKSVHDLHEVTLKMKHPVDTFDLVFKSPFDPAVCLMCSFCDSFNGSVKKGTKLGRNFYCYKCGRFNGHLRNDRVQELTIKEKGDESMDVTQLAISDRKASTDEGTPLNHLRLRQPQESFRSPVGSNVDSQ